MAGMRIVAILLLLACVGVYAAPTNPCLLPKKTGSCRAAFKRFYYDKVKQECRRFTYGGCEGNGNNFKTWAECTATCTYPPVVIVDDYDRGMDETFLQGRKQDSYKDESSAEHLPGKN